MIAVIWLLALLREMTLGRPKRVSGGRVIFRDWWQRHDRPTSHCLCSLLSII